MGIYFSSRNQSNTSSVGAIALWNAQFVFQPSSVGAADVRGAGDYREACSALLHGDPYGGGFNRKQMPALRAVHFSFQGFRSSKLGQAFGILDSGITRFARDPFGGGFNRKPMPALRAVHFSFQGFRSSKLG